VCSGARQCVMGVCLGSAPRVHTCGRVCARKGAGKTVSSCIHLQAIHALRAECAPPARNQCTLSKMVTYHEHQRSHRRLPSMPGPSCHFFTSQCAQLTSQNMLRKELEGFIAPQAIFRGKDFGISGHKFVGKWLRSGTRLGMCRHSALWRAEGGAARSDPRSLGGVVCHVKPP